jgi:hypothetical protein
MGFVLPMTYTSDAGQVNGQSFDEVAFDLSQLPIPPEMQQGMRMALGGNLTVTEQIARLDNQRIAMAIGQGNLEQALNVVKNSPGTLDKQAEVAKVAAHLPAKANVIGFANVGKSMAAAMEQQAGAMDPGMMMMMGMFSQIQGTVGYAGTLQEGMASGELFVPTELIQSVVQMGMAMTAGMGPPGGGMEMEEEPEEDEAEPAPTF